MNDYIVSARKYRPMTFDSVVGQSALTTTLKKSIQTGHLAHAYLFCGPRGVGKTTCARIFAKTINCLSPNADGEACGECESCKAFNEQRSLNIYELDAASNNGVEEIKKLIEQTRIPPQVGKYKVFIIDEVHMLSNAAFNAFLKTLEEPPHYVIFILATTEKHKLLPTILSRCQIYDFNRMNIQDTVDHLQHVAEKEGITVEPAALHVIAEKADGGMRDALSIFDQVAAFCSGNITYSQTIDNLNVLDYDYYFKLVDMFLGCKIPDILATYNDIVSKGFEGNHFINGLNNHFRNLLLSRDKMITQLMDVSQEVQARYHEQSIKCKPQFIYSAIRKCTDCDLNYKLSQNKRLLVEITLIEIAQLTQDDGASSGRRPAKRLKPIFNVAAVKSSVASAPAQSASAAANSAAGSAYATTSARPAAGSVHAASSATRSAASPSAGSTAGSAAPVHHAPVAPAPKSSSVLKSFSLRDLGSEGMAGNSVSEAKTDVHSETRKIDANAKLDLYELLTQIKIYATNLDASQAGLKARLMRVEPTLVNDNTFEFVADNPLVRKQYDELAPKLSRYLAEKFCMAEVNMQVKESDYKHKQVLTRAQLFSKMKESNPALAILEKELKLHL